MNRNLNANTLFHFTKKYDYLKSIIIKDGFYPRYCFEEFLGGAKRFKKVLEQFNLGIKNEIIGIPMVCFCDIRLSQINYHMENYGKYGIGLSKEWINRQFLSQVIYMQSAENGMVSDTLQSLLLQIPQYHTNEILKSSFIDLASCVKPYEGKSWDREKKMYKKEKTIFYNEREWRFLPCIRTHHINHKNTDIKALISLDDNFEEENTKLASAYKLDFAPEDIKYIIVPNNEERISLEKDIKKLHKSSHEILISKILTKNQINDNEIHKILTEEEIEEDF